MDGIKSYAMMLCFASAAAGIAKSLIPSPKFDGVMKLIIGAFVLCALISPLNKTIKGISDISEMTYTARSIDVNGQTEALLTREIKSKIVQFFLNAGIAVNKVEVEINISDEGVIMLDSHSINIDKSYQSREAEIVGEFKKSFGFSPIIIYE